MICHKTIGVATGRGPSWLWRGLIHGILPTPGAKRRKNLEENVAALGITLTNEEMSVVNRRTARRRLNVGWLKQW
jgi:diketogulonate reductase-like aldo/keto reductase